MIKTILNSIRVAMTKTSSYKDESLVKYPDYIIFDESNRQEVLTHLGLFEDFQAKRIRCPSCDEVITNNNMRAIMPTDNGKSEIICDNPICYHNYLFYKKYESD